MTKRSVKALILTALVLAGACAQPEVPEDNFYRLRIEPPKNATPSPRFKGTIEIERFAADGLTAGRPIVYTEPGQAHRLKEYHYHFWTEPPTVMLRDQLVMYLRAAGVADAVVTPEMRVEPQFVLTGKIKRLEKVTGSKPMAVLELELGLREASGGKLVFLDTYLVEREAENDSVGAAVQALNRALAEAYARFTASVTRQ
jgi:ABC-type uncharacterized transport system auxiliary subunit